MTREELEALILLSESGELDPAAEARLREGLSEHPGVQAATLGLLADVREALPDEGPSEFVMARIRNEAEQALTPQIGTQVQSDARGLGLSAWSRLSWAAALVLVVGLVWAALRSDTGPDVGEGPEVAMLGDQAASVSALIAMTDEEAELSVGADSESEPLRVLARQLLEMQGFDANEGFFDEGLALEPDVTQQRLLDVGVDVEVEVLRRV